MVDRYPVTAAVSRDAHNPPALEELSLRTPARGEVLVRVTHAGICHTDIACHQGHIPVRRPIVLGHEGAGFVEVVGDGVEDVHAGDRVVMSLTSCGRCPGCIRDGIYCQRSAELNIMGGGIDGTSTYLDSDVKRHYFGQSSFATHALAYERNVVKVPDDLPLELAAPLGCGIMTGAGAIINALNVRPGQSVAIFGAGAVGLAAAQAAVLSGASQICVIDLLESRLDLARRIGATDVINGRDRDPVGALLDITGGGADHVVEASGNANALRHAADAVGRRGTCAIVGAGHGEVSFDTNALRMKGASIRGVSMGDANPRTFLPKLMEEMRNGRLRLDELVTPYSFADIATAFDDAERGAAVKPVLAMP